MLQKAISRRPRLNEADSAALCAIAVYAIATQSKRRKASERKSDVAGGNGRAEHGWWAIALASRNAQRRAAPAACCARRCCALPPVARCYASLLLRCALPAAPHRWRASRASRHGVSAIFSRRRLRNESNRNDGNESVMRHPAEMAAMPRKAAYRESVKSL